MRLGAWVLAIQDSQVESLTVRFGGAGGGGIKNVKSINLSRSSGVHRSVERHLESGQSYLSMSKTKFRVARRVVSALTATATVMTVGGSALLGLAVAPADYGLTEGDVIRALNSANDPDIYIVNEHGYKRLFVNPQIFNLYGHIGWESVKEVPAATRDAFPTSGLFRNCESGAQAVYGIEVVSEDVANLHHVNISGAQAVAEDADFFKKVFCINNSEQALYGTGSPWTSLSQVPDYSRDGETEEGDTSNEGLNGSVGDITRADWISALNNEKVGEGENNIKVAGLEIEAGQDSDIRLISAKIEVENTDAGSSKKPRDFMKSVGVYFDGTKVATIDGDEFFDDTGDTWTKTVSFPSSSIIRMDGVKKLEFAVSALDVIDSADHDSDTWQFSVINVRFVDGQGAITTDSSTGDIALDGLTDRPFDFRSYAGAADLELNLTKGSDHPKARIVEVASESDTEGVLLFSGTLKNEGDDAVMVKELAFNIATATANLGDSVNSLTLEIDGTDVQSIDPGSADCTAATATVCTFDDVDVDFNDGESKSVKLFAEVAGSENQEGAQVKATLTMSDAGNVVEDMNGDNLAAGDKTGSVTGDFQAFYSWALGLELISTTASKTTGDSTPDLGTFTIKFRATAFGGSVFVQEGCSGDLATSGSAEFVLTSGGTASVSSNCLITPTDNTIDDDSSFGNFEILEGDSEEFTLTVVETGADTFVNVRLEGVDWATSDITDPATFYEFNLENFKTDDIFLSST